MSLHTDWETVQEALKELQKKYPFCYLTFSSNGVWSISYDV